MATRRERRTKAVAYLTLDLVVVLLFIVAGRDTRGAGITGSLFEALPFFAGTLLGWGVSRAWRHPRSVFPAGIVIWLATVAVGLPVRALAGDPTDTRFVSITFVALGAFLLGWRAVAWVLNALFGRALEKVVDEKYRR